MTKFIGWTAGALALALLVCPAASEEQAAADLPALLAEVSRLEGAGQYDEAVNAARMVVASLEKSAGPNRLPLGKALLSLARLHVMRGKAQEAVPVLERAAKTLEDIDDRQQPEVADALNDLGMIYQMKGRPAEALPVYRRALLIRNRETDSLNERLKSITASQSQPEDEGAASAAEQPLPADASAEIIQAEEAAGGPAARMQAPEAEPDERTALAMNAAEPSANPPDPQSAANEPEQPAETPSEVPQQPLSPNSRPDELALEAAQQPQSRDADEEPNAATGPVAGPETQAEAALQPAPMASDEGRTEPLTPEQQALVPTSRPDARIKATSPSAAPEIAQPFEATPPAVLSDDGEPPATVKQNQPDAEQQPQAPAYESAIAEPPAQPATEASKLEASAPDAQQTPLPPVQDQPSAQDRGEASRQSGEEIALPEQGLDKAAEIAAPPAQQAETHGARQAAQPDGPAVEQNAGQPPAEPYAVSESASEEPGSFAHDVPEPERRPRPDGSAFALIEPERGESETAPTLAADLFAKLEIVYYRKPEDGEKIIAALSKRKIAHQVIRSAAQQFSVSNAIACGPDTPVEALKFLAHAFIDSGVPLRAITRFRNPSAKKQRFEIYTVADVSTEDGRVTTSPLTREQIDAITACPQLIQN